MDQTVDHPQSFFTLSGRYSVSVLWDVYSPEISFQSLDRPIPELDRPIVCLSVSS